MTKKKTNIVHGSAIANLNKKRYILLVTQKYIWNTKNFLITNILSIQVTPSIHKTTVLMLTSTL